MAAPDPIYISHRAGRYPVFFEALDGLPSWLAEAGLRRGRCLVVTDTQVESLHGARLRTVLEVAGWEPHFISVPSGEDSKSLEILGALYDEALRFGIDRKTPVLAFGGGVVGDLAGFAAATLLRGLPLVQIPTTVIAQVDSALGGKTGINHAVGKNLIGAFYPPALVFADPSLLFTLPEREWTSGLAEVVKHGMIRDGAFLDWMEARWNDILQQDPGAVAMLVRRGASIKAEVVSADEYESGLRAILNFGHTFGHSIERVAGYGTFTHGEAVALGMRAALWLSKQFHPALPFERLDAFTARIPVPASGNALPLPALIQSLGSDKKADAGDVRFVLLDGVGSAYVRGGIPRELVEAAFRHALGFHLG